MAIIRGRVRKQVGNPNMIKGVSLNPKGRPKGAYSSTTLSFIKLKDIASTRVEEAFNMLWAAMERGEAWAHQIYFKELYTLPRNIDEKKIVIEDKEVSVDGQIKALTEILPSFDEITHDESLKRLKVLNDVKGNEVLTKQTEEIKETRESLLEKVELIQRIRDMKDDIESDKK